MARKTQSITIEREGRDNGKAFLLTEMSASDAERWATRAILSLGRSGVEIPEDLENSGMAGIAIVGIRAIGTMAFEDAEPLLAEMMECIQRIPDAAQSSVIRPLVEDDIEEVSTRLHLRSEVIALHLGFSIADVLSKLGALAKQRANLSSITETPPGPSAPSSLPESPV